MAVKREGPRPLQARVLQIVRLIPRGRVLTYGQVALFAGVPRGARQVGRILYQSGGAPGVPWQRVVNRYGGLSTYKIGHGDLQRELLEAEGVKFLEDGTLGLADYQWHPSPGVIKKLALPPEIAFEVNKKLPYSR